LISIIPEGTSRILLYTIFLTFACFWIHTYQKAKIKKQLTRGTGHYTLTPAEKYTRKTTGSAFQIKSAARKATRWLIQQKQMERGFFNSTDG
jgi:hypothetical protein